MIFKFLALSLCLVLSSSSSYEAAHHEETGNAVDFVSTDGLHISFPYLPGVFSMDQHYRDVSAFHVIKVLHYVKEVAGKSLMSQKVHRFGWAGVTTNLIKLGKESKNARKDFKKTPGTGGKFNSEMSGMFKKMMAESKIIEKTLEPESPLVLKEEIDSVMDGLVEAVNKSPVASYFDWRNGNLNGETFISAAARYMARLSKQGYGTFMSCISALLSLIEKLSCIG